MHQVRVVSETKKVKYKQTLKVSVSTKCIVKVRQFHLQDLADNVRKMENNRKL